MKKVSNQEKGEQLENKTKAKKAERDKQSRFLSKGPFKIFVLRSDQLRS